MIIDGMSDLKTGKELDTLIEEKVLRKVPCDKWKLFRAGGIQGPEWIKDTCKHDCYPRGSPSAFSTNMSATWSAVLELESRGFIISLLDRLAYRKLLSGDVVSMWRCEFMDAGARAEKRPVGEIWLGVVYDETAQLAICGAMLAMAERKTEAMPA